MQMQVEAERKKRAAVLESEGMGYMSLRLDPSVKNSFVYKTSLQGYLSFVLRKISILRPPGE